MEKALEKVVVLIPSLEPDAILMEYVKGLLSRNYMQVLVVDDGSGEAYAAVFDALEALEGCTVLHHAQNCGKGAALKTGYAYIQKMLPACVGVVTADADGQHAAEDVKKLALAAANTSGTLLLGSRDFSESHVPFKSRYGNRITSGVFCMLYGKWLPDTQTGLRAFSTSLLEKMIAVRGERFEYETQVLIDCVRAHIPMQAITIQTLYENDNSGTHFHPFRDSAKIYKVLFGNFFKFFSSSIAATCIDLLLAWTIMDVLRAPLAGHDFLRIAIATAGARVVSAGVNFTLNKYVVFQHKQKTGTALWRYVLLCVLVASLSALSVTLLHTLLGVNEKLAKVLCDTCLFILSYQAQARWVFSQKENKSLSKSE